MESSSDSPFAFFDYYLNNEIHDEWKLFRSELVEHVFGSGKDEIDESNKKVKVYNSEKNDFDIYSFENHIKEKVQNEIFKTNQFLQKGFLQRYSNQNEVRSYAKFNVRLIQRLRGLQACKEFTFIDLIFNEVLSQINHFSNGMIVQGPVYSFNLLDKNNIGQEQLIKKLHELLNESPSLINCSISEFNSAFTGGIVENGINWMGTAKNKSTNKKSLIYLLDELIRHKFISSTIALDKNKLTKYCFRDSNGNELQNLRQSRTDNSKKVTDQDRIDAIISSL